MAGLTRSRATVVGAVALPGLAWVLATVVWLAGLAVGVDPTFPAYDPATLSEADNDDVTRWSREIDETGSDVVVEDVVLEPAPDASASGQVLPEPPAVVLD